MRRFLVVIALAALSGCAPHSASGPAWPKAAATEDDGGESLAPHETRQLAVIEKGDDDVKPVTPTATAPTAAPSGDVVAPVVAPAVTLPVEETTTTTTEDIIIEIDD